MRVKVRIERLALKKIILIVIAVNAAFLAAYASSSIYDQLTVVSSQEFGMRVTVGSYAGYDVTTSEIVFGTIPPGSISIRNITFSNNFTFPVRVEQTASGELAPWVSTHDNYFVLQPGEAKNLGVALELPTGIEHRNYTGKFRINFRKI